MPHRKLLSGRAVRDCLLQGGAGQSGCEGAGQDRNWCQPGVGELPRICMRSIRGLPCGLVFDDLAHAEKVAEAKLGLPIRLASFPMLGVPSGLTTRSAVRE